LQSLVLETAVGVMRAEVAVELLQEVKDAIPHTGA